MAASSFGLPDLGFTKLDDVIEDARRITTSCDLPLLVDIDTGFGSIKSNQNQDILIGLSLRFCC